MIWILGASLIANVVLLVVYFVESRESREWKDVAKMGFDREAREVENRRRFVPIGGALSVTAGCPRCSSNSRTVVHSLGSCCPVLARRDVN